MRAVKSQEKLAGSWTFHEDASCDTVGDGHHHGNIHQVCVWLNQLHLKPRTVPLFVLLLLHIALTQDFPSSQWSGLSTKRKGERCDDRHQKDISAWLNGDHGDHDE